MLENKPLNATEILFDRWLRVISNCLASYSPERKISISNKRFFLKYFQQQQNFFCKK